MEYTFLMPTKVFFGCNCIGENASVLDRFGKRALIVTGRSASKKNGSLKDTENALKDRNISWEVFDRVECNPSIENVREGAALAKDFQADFIIGIGGGSPMDAAKAISVLAVNDVDDDALFSGHFKHTELPIIAVPTTAGTGSEVTPYSILTVHKIKNKKNLSTENLFPKVAFLDARYTSGLPHDLTVNTALDAFSHAVEGFLSVASTDMSDFIALKSIRLIGECFSDLRSGEPVSSDVREKLLHASMLAGIVISQTGTTLVHAMGYSLTYFKQIDHGRANALLMPEYFRFIAKFRPEKINAILDATGMASLDEFRLMTDHLLGKKETITKEEVEAFAETALDAGSTKKTDPMPTRSDIEMIYRKSLPPV